jgi:hypothetical protein
MVLKSISTTELDAALKAISSAYFFLLSAGENSHVRKAISLRHQP